MRQAFSVIFALFFFFPELSEFWTSNLLAARCFRKIFRGSGELGHQRLLRWGSTDVLYGDVATILVPRCSKAKGAFVTLHSAGIHSGEIRGRNRVENNWINAVGMSLSHVAVPPRLDRCRPDLAGSCLEPNLCGMATTIQAPEYQGATTVLPVPPVQTRNDQPLNKRLMLYHGTNGDSLIYESWPLKIQTSVLKHAQSSYGVIKILKCFEILLLKSSPWFCGITIFINPQVVDVPDVVPSEALLAAMKAERQRLQQFRGCCQFHLS